MSPAVPLQLLDVGAAFWKNPDAPAVRRSSVQIEGQAVHLLRLAAREDGHLAAPRDRPQIEDPQEVPGLMNKYNKQHVSPQEVQRGADVQHLHQDRVEVKRRHSSWQTEWSISRESRGNILLS